MRMRERLPFLSGPERLEPAPEAVATMDAPAAGERAAEGEIGTVERLGGALATIAQVMGGEIDSLRNDIKEMETRIQRRIDTEKTFAAASLDAFRNEVFSRIEELRVGQRTALAGFTDEIKTTTMALKESMERVEAQSEARSEGVRNALEQALSEKEQKFEKDLETLSKNLTRAQFQLQQLSTLLSGVAGIFTEHQGREPQLRTGTRAPVGAPESRSPDTAG